MMGHHQHAREMPLNGVSLAGRWWPAYSAVFGFSLSSSTYKKNHIKVGPLWQNFLDPRMQVYSGLYLRVGNRKIIFLFLNQNICLKLWVRKYWRFYANFCCLSKPVYTYSSICLPTGSASIFCFIAFRARFAVTSPSVAIESRQKMEILYNTSMEDCSKFLWKIQIDILQYALATGLKILSHEGRHTFFF